MRGQSNACVYTITHVASGLVYVGSTNDVKIRWKDHRQKLRAGAHKNPRLQAAWSADGAQAFVFAIVEQIAEPDKLRDVEQRWLDTLRPFDPERGFNIDFDSRGRTGRPRTAEAIERTAAAHRGRKQSAETRARISAKAQGRVPHNRRFTDDQIKEMRTQLANGVSDSEVGRRYGAPPQTIRRIRIGEAYPIIAGPQAERPLAPGPVLAELRQGCLL